MGERPVPRQPTVVLVPSSYDDNGDVRNSDVSPVGSPELRAASRDSESSFCVSPIDEPDHHPRDYSRDTPAPAPIPNPNSNRADTSDWTPPNRAQSAQQKPQILANCDQPTRWDAYSGEPTTGDGGRAGQVTPHNTTFDKPSGSHASNLLSWGREQFQPKKKLAEARSRLSNFSKNDPSASKGPRRRSSSRVLPLKEQSGNKRSSIIEATPENTHLGLVPTTVTTVTAGDSKPLPERPATERDYSSQPTRHQYQPDPQFEIATDNMVPPDPFVSHFSATTTATSSQIPSPRESLHLETQSTDDLASSIMSRRRPLPNAMPTSGKPVRKPTPSQAPHPAATDVPSQQNPQSRIELWEAKRKELAQRRHNLETVIHELTHVIQPSSTAYDLAAKAEVKKTVSSMQNEIAEIRREEHELGLKVTRAWRRLDEKDNNGDGSCLWVKRVTG